MGIYLTALERSTTFHVFADVLSAASRLLTPTFSESALARVDVDAVGLALYVAVQAIAGALLGVVLSRTPWRSRAILRAVALGVGLALADGVGLSALWRHRGLPAALGWALVGGAAGVGAVAAALAGRIATLLPARARALLAALLPLAIVGASALTLVGARRAPGRPAGQIVDSPARVPGAKVAIIALDGLDGRLVDDALAQGRLPNLRALIARGVRGDLRSIRPPKSPVVWTSVVTGVLPKTHGIVDFVVRREGQRIPVTSNLRRSPALWNLAGPAGFTVGFVNWYVTWPAESVAGAIVSDRADFAALPDRVFPAELTAAIDSARADVDARPERDVARFTDLPGDYAAWSATQWGQVRRSLAILDGVVRHDLVTLASAEVVLGRGQPDLAAFYFRGTDNTQHLFWKHRLAARRASWAGLLYGNIDSTEVKALAPVIDRYYDFADEMLGRILSRLDPQTAVLVVSDHGFLTNNERGRWYNANRLLAAAGLCVLAPNSGGVAESTSSAVLDPEPPSVAARRLLRAGGAAGAEGKAALGRARDVLAGARTDRGEPVFRSLALGEDEHGPRLAVVFADRLAGRAVRLGNVDVPVEEFLEPEGHSGDHRMNGFILAAGPPFRHGRIDGARAVDLAPTVLCLLGAPAALDMEGVVLVDLFDPAWRSAHPVRYVRTYGTRETLESSAIATDADDRIREELRALGYIN
ncbi:MAG: alkaline phosphatase family protein [bacterium]